MKHDEHDPWAEAYIALVRLWGYRREAALLTAVAAMWMFLPRAVAIVLTIAAFAATIKWLGPWLHTAHVRRQWARAVISAGAADPPPRRSRKAKHIIGPKVLKVRTTPVGDELTVKVGRGRGTVASLTAHADQIAADMDSWHSHVHEVRVASLGEGASRARVLVVRHDPFAQAAPIDWPARDAEKLNLWNPIQLGVNELGQPVAINLVEKNLLIGGEPGAGKSAALSLIVATAALDPETRLYLLDGKQVELSAWAPRAEALIGPDIQKANILLSHLRNVMEARYQELHDEGVRTRRVVRKVRPGMTLHVLVCDELALYTQSVDKEQRRIFNEQLRDLIARGRAAGVIVVAATQKPSVDAVPSMIRDIMQLRLALRCTTPQASDTILGQGQAAAGADASTVRVEQRGVGYLLAEGEHPVRLKACYLNDDDISDIAERAVSERAETELQAMLAEAHRPTQQSVAVAEQPEPSPTSPTPSLPQQGRSSVADCLPTEGEGITRAQWVQATGRRQWKYLADDASALLERGEVIQTGAGVRGDPFRYRRIPAPEGTESDSM